MLSLDPRIRKNELIYLAGPYSAEDPELVEERALIHIKTAALIIEQGYMCFSPIAHSHPIWLVSNNLPKDAGFWGRYNEEWLSHCKHLLVLLLMGWEESKGTRMEMLLARRTDKPIYMIDPPIEALTFSACKNIIL